ncbi:hypothetical protein SCG61_001004 [Salmonella enterica]|nr:hypothetical protein [Salmonella enterica]
MRFAFLFFTSILISGCVHQQNVQATEPQKTVDVTHQSSSLTAEQTAMLVGMQNYMQITELLTDACEVAADGEQEKAIDILKQIDWKKSEVQVPASGVDNGGIINFFLRQPNFNKESCAEYSSALYRDSINK